MRRFGRGVIRGVGSDVGGEVKSDDSGEFEVEV